jgi:hypothetical protein
MSPILIVVGEMPGALAVLPDDPPDDAPVVAEVEPAAVVAGLDAVVLLLLDPLLDEHAPISRPATAIPINPTSGLLMFLDPP